MTQAVLLVACAVSVAGFVPSTTVTAAGRLRSAAEGALDEVDLLRDRLLAQLDEAPPALVVPGAQSDAIERTCNALARGAAGLSLSLPEPRASSASRRGAVDGHVDRTSATRGAPVCAAPSLCL